MKLERLIVHSLTSITHVDLDLAALPPGLIAFVGEYGAGKTTLLEAPIGALYRCLPSRDGDLKDYATAKDAYVEEIFVVTEHGEPNRYRVRVNLDGVRGTSDAVLEFIGLASGHVVPLNDGKVTTFDQAVRQRFPSKEIVLAAAMATQNKRGGFVGKKPKEKAELFSDLLGLTASLRMSETAKQAAATLAAEIDRLSRVHDELAGQRDRLDVVDLDRWEAATAAQEQVLQDQRAALETADAAAARLQDGAVQYARASERWTRLRGELLTAETGLAGIDPARGRISHDAVAARARLAAKAQTDTRDARAAHEAVLADRQKRIANNQAVIARAATIRQAVAAVATLERDLTGWRAELTRLRTEQATALQAVLVAERPLDAAYEARDELLRIDRATEILGQVPCGGEGAYAGCQFIVDASAAKTRVPDLTAQVQTIPDLKAVVAAQDAVYQAYAPQIAACEHGIREAEATLARHKTAAAEAPALAAAETKIAEHERAIVDDEARHAARIAQIVRDRQFGETEIETRRVAALADLDARAEDLRATIARLTTERDAAARAMAATEAVHAEARVLEAKLPALRAAVETAVRQLADGRAARAAAVQRATDRATLTARLTTLDQQVDALQSELLEWQLLQRALGRDGIPMLEIDAAGPLISQTTNELLGAAFGPRFSVDLVTQQAKADGGMKDAFDLLVYDNDRGGEQRRLADLSGGEQVVVSEALMNALALYVNAHAPMRLETIWRDETVGALNAAARGQYVQMLRKVQQIGGYHHVFIVTHDDEIAAMCDAQVRVDKPTGTAAIVQPPYDEAA